MDVIGESLQDSLLPAIGEAIGKVSTISWVIVKVMTFLSLADVNVMFTISVSIITFFYIGLKAYNELMITIDRKKKQKPE